MAAVPRVELEAPPGMAIALRVRLANRMMAAVLVRPQVDDWVSSEGEILPAGARIEPAYVYLLQGAEVRQTVTLRVPLHLKEGTRLTSALRFPGISEQAVAIALGVRGGDGDAPLPALECPLEVSLPLGDDAPRAGGDEFGSAAQASYSLVAGLAGLDMLPARWLVAELLTAVCQAGEAQTDSEAGRALLERLGRTRFFKNGVVAFASAQAPRWILSGLSATSGLHAAMGGQLGQGQLLHIWERWLLGLADADIERGDAAPEVRVPDVQLQAFAATLGTQADRWFANLLLGLALLSPRVASALEQIAARAPEPPPPPAEAAPRAGGDDVLGEDGSLGR
ncbi:MAG: hypothetical protein JSR38_06165 [Proteobacteria bacterium]|uniref:hypothetical protein n=1 Tax=Piscinibacter sp. TaxID=1903157 RepID=UPI001B614D9A|nr:hypothetical protein [Piscinibacter sp.]MBP5989582.1 hypothetical protein [Piscinibacter sp.]MBP6029476.1 hypothetical protein [Piscinibacter sp.]MBS0441513.1 hypothetical protein [Pseudomonadota bacterium]